MRKKVSFLGAGNVGATAAMYLAELDIADIVLVDVLEDMTKGKALDMAEAAPVFRFNCRFTNDFNDIKGSDIIVITAGIPRKPGMSRDDLLFTNQDIIGSLVKKVAPLAPDAILIIVTNPLDAMCHVAHEVSGFPKNKIVGMAGVLDSSRFAAFIAMELDVSIENIQAFVLGGHGDTMVPLPRFTSVAGIPVTRFINNERLNAIIERTRNGGAEITNLLKTSAYYAPASAIREMAEAILKDKKKIMPCSAYLEGEYGIKNMFVGVPVKLGADGVEQIIEIELTESEKAELKKSVDSVNSLVEAMKGRS
ncbi:MAG: malate dehydrogenase [Smithella sp.]|nr:malate dehydrogenase [Smithella sp.]